MKFVKCGYKTKNFQLENNLARGTLSLLQLFLKKFILIYFNLYSNDNMSNN